MENASSKSMIVVGIKCRGLANDSIFKLNVIVKFIGLALTKSLELINVSSACSLRISEGPWALATNHVTGSLVFPWALLGIYMQLS
jgi:hypothetical protein